MRREPLRRLLTHEIGRLPSEAVKELTRHPAVLVVEDVRSAFNVGSMLRTADALLLDHVYLTGFTPDGNHRGVHKAALGAQSSVPWTHVPESEDILHQLREEGFTLAAVEITDSPRSALSLETGDFPLALVVGNEVQGVSESALALCDLALELPQFGAKHSLNVAVAFGVVGYDVVRRWRDLHHLT